MDGDQLALFEGGIDMVKLKAEALRIRSVSRAPSTMRAYASDFADFAAWCKRAGRSSMPARAATLELYVVDQLARFKLSTVGRRIAGVVASHVRENQPSPYGENCELIMKGARRERGSAQDSAAALSALDLRAICRSLPSARPKTAARDRAILTLGFAAALRRAELVALDVRDVEFVRQGVVVHVRRGKTDQEGRGRIAGVFHGTRAAYSCPVKLLRAWLKVRGRKDGPLFPSTGATGRLTCAAVNKIVKRSVELVGLDASRYSAHSLRAGFVTAAAEAGVPESLIMQRTGHRSIQTVARYVRPASVFSSDALARAL
jgi:integrase